MLRLKGSRRGLALTVDGNGRWCRLDPQGGAQLAVAEAARHLVAVGARPLAVTNCLNFGNPEKPEIMGQFSAVIDGMAEADDQGATHVGRVMWQADDVDGVTMIECVGGAKPGDFVRGRIEECNDYDFRAVALS